MADLTGWTDSTGQTSPFSRSTPTERAAAAEYLFQTLREHGLDPRHHRYKWPNVHGLIDLFVPPYVGANVVVEIRATLPSSEYVVLGAHYDSEFRSPGAIDNASGVAVVLATAVAVGELSSHAAAELKRAGFLRASGTVAGVVLERHLRSVSLARSLTIRKKAPTIGDLNDLLKEKAVLDVPTWRFVQRLADLRNLCAHSRDREPTLDEVGELLEGVAKACKRIY